jgi:hypothetical protein
MTDDRTDDEPGRFSAAPGAAEGPRRDDATRLGDLAAELADRGVRRVHALQWRDLEDPEAGGSEIHADEVFRRWAEAGLEVTLRTSHADGRPAETERHGYRVVRRGSRYGVFPRTAVAELLGRLGPYDALIEIWNGVPWFSPIWCRRPRVTWLHHIHGPMWDQIFLGPLARAGRVLEGHFAPPFYRRTEIALAEPSPRLEDVGFSHPRRAAGVGHVNYAGGRVRPPRRRHQSLVAQAVQPPRGRHAAGSSAGLELVIVGEAPSARCQTRRSDLHAEDWLHRRTIYAGGLVELPPGVGRLQPWPRLWNVARGGGVRPRPSPPR